MNTSTGVPASAVTQCGAVISLGVIAQCVRTASHVKKVTAAGHTYGVLAVGLKDI